MMKRLVPLLALCSPAFAALSVPSTPVRNLSAGAVTSHTCSLSGVQAHDTLDIFFSDRTGGASISGVTDDEAGSYTVRSTLTVSTFLSVMYVREDVALPSAGTIVITITTSGNITSQVVCRIVRSDAGGVTYPDFDQAATPVDGSASTTAVSNTLAASAAGLLSGSFFTGNAQASDPTVGDHASLTGEAVGPTTAAGVRAFAVYGTNAASGTLGFTVAASASVTLSTSSAYQFHLINYIESGAAASGLLLRRRRN